MMTSHQRDMIPLFVPRLIDSFVNETIKDKFSHDRRTDRPTTSKKKIERYIGRHSQSSSVRRNGMSKTSADTGDKENSKQESNRA